MIIKRFITFVIALSLAFSVSTAMAGKSDKSDKSGKSWNHSYKSDKSDKSDKSRKGKRGKKGKNSDKSDKSDKSRKSDKSGKSDKSDKSDKSRKSDKDDPTMCFSDWDIDFDPATGGEEGEGGYIETGEIVGTVCTLEELEDILADEYSPVGAPDTFCEVEPGEDDVFGSEGPYEVSLLLTCSTDVGGDDGPIIEL